MWLRFALPLIVLSALIAVLGSIAYGTLAEEIRRETHRTLAVIAEQKRQQIEAWLDETRGDAELHFGDHSQLHHLLARWQSARDDALLSQMRELANRLARNRGWSGLAVFDASGQVVFSIGQIEIEPHRRQIADVLSNPGVQLVDLYRGTGGDVHHGVITPIGAAGQPPIGFAYLTWKADEVLFPLVESWPVPTRSAETYLVGRDPAGVRFLTPLRHDDSEVLDLVLPLDGPTLTAARVMLDERGILAGSRDYRGVPVLSYAAPVAGTPWWMLAEIDEVEAYAGLRTMTWATAAVIAVGLIFIFSVAFLLWRRDRQRRALAILQAQRAAESRFRVIFEQAPLGVAVLDSRYSRVLEANQRFSEIIGLTPEQTVGLDPFAITHPDDLETSREHIVRLNARQISSYRLNKRYLRPDGSVVWANLTCATIQVEPDQPPRYLAIVEDISERHRYEQALQQAHDAAEAANAAKSEFLAHMSHEIRTPLNAVLGLAQVLGRDDLRPAQREMVERIRGAGQSLLAILNDVLDLSKIEAGQLRIESRPFELDPLLANLYSLMGQTARGKGLKLIVDRAPEGLGNLLGDGLRLEQVLFNLTTNAIKFTERGAVELRVRTVSCDEHEARLRFVVRDSGIGIAPEVLPCLFNPFTQADGGIGRRYGGTGLGLSICKRLVELMSGQIGVESDPGQGSTFWFELPFARARQSEAAATSTPTTPQEAGPRLQGAHVLVVDDSAMNRDLVERALALEGACATLAADGQQAVQLLQSDPTAFDAVLMDIQMPVMDGLRATRKIREELGLTRLPVIAFTAGVRNDQQEAAQNAGANAVLPKPMDIDQMAELLAQWIDPAAIRSREADQATASLAHETSTPTQSEPPAETPAAPAASGSGIPAIAGIDQEKVTQRLAGDREMFLSLVQFFADDNADAVASTRADLANGDRSSAGRRIHTLASNAGFICAFPVMDLARKVEAAIDRGEAALDPSLDELETRVAALIAALKPWLA